MPTPNGEQFVAYHGTVSPRSWRNAPWVHLGDKDAAHRRLEAVSDPGSFERSDEPKPEPSMFKVEMSPTARVAPFVEAEEDDETGMWMDLGHRLSEGTWDPDDDDDAYDVYPYENIDEGGTSYYVKNEAINKALRIPRRR